MKEKRYILSSAIVIGFLAVIMAASTGLNAQDMEDIGNMESSQKPENNREALLEEAMPFADEQAFQALKEVYEGSDFYGEFKKGNTEIYDYYKEKYAKLLNGEVKITDHGYEKEWKSYQHDRNDLISNVSGKIYYFDMDDDSLPELCIAGKYGTHIFKYIPDTDQYQIWWEELRNGGSITGSGKIKSRSDLSYDIKEASYAFSSATYSFYSFSQINKSGYLDYWLGFGIDNYESTPLYMVSWPVYQNETKRIEMPKGLKSQSYTSEEPDWRDGYYFRVTKEQYEELTAEYFKADAISQWQRVSLSYFFPELEGTYGSYREFPFDMPYADEPTLQMLEKSYREINFHSSFGRGNTKYYEKYKEKYRELLTNEATFLDEDESEWFLEDYIYDLDVLKDISTRLYYFDIDGDNQPELCIETTEETYIFKYSSDTDQFRLWWYTWDKSCEIAGKRQIREKGDAFHKFYEWKEDGTENFNIMFGVMETGDKEDLYIVSLPGHEDKAVSSEIPEQMVKQSYISLETGNYFFRVTKEQYEKLTREYFETNMDAVWRRVPFSFFFI